MRKPGLCAQALIFRSDKTKILLKLTDYVCVAVPFAHLLAKF